MCWMGFGFWQDVARFLDDGFWKEYWCLILDGLWKDFERSLEGTGQVPGMFFFGGGGGFGKILVRCWKDLGIWKGFQGLYVDLEGF